MMIVVVGGGRHRQMSAKHRDGFTRGRWLNYNNLKVIRATPPHFYEHICPCFWPFFAIQASRRSVLLLPELQRARGDGEGRRRPLSLWLLGVDVAHFPLVFFCNALKPRRILPEPKHAGTPGVIRS